MRNAISCPPGGSYRTYLAFLVPLGGKNGLDRTDLALLVPFTSAGRGIGEAANRRKRRSVALAAQRC